MKQLIFNPVILLILAAIGIVFFLLGIHLSNKKNINLGLRQAVIFLFLLTGFNLTVPPFVYLYPDALTGFDKTIGSAIFQLGIYAFTVFILRSWFALLPHRILLLFKNPFLGLFIIFSTLSCLWSETLDLSLRSGLVFLSVSIVSAHIARDLTWQALAQLLRRLIFGAAIFSFLLAVFMPSTAFNEKGLQGIFPFPIKLGTCMALGIALWFSYLLEQQKERWKVIGIMIFLMMPLVLSQSGQGIITCFALVSLVGLMKVLKQAEKLAPVVILFYLATSILVGESANTVIPKIFGSLGKDTTLTGRTDFWPQLIERLGQHNLLLGYGINGFWQPWRGASNPATGIFNSSGFVPPHAHNGFIDLALSMGLIGFILFSVSFLLGLSQAVQYFLTSKTSDSNLPLILLVYVIFSNISETQLVGSNYIWILYVITLIRLNIRKPQSYFSAGETRQSSYPLIQRSYLTSIQNSDHN
jgi:O-antigen ligase